MPVYAYLAGAWRQGKVVWHWNGSAWVKADKVFIYDAGAWQLGHDRPLMTTCTLTEIAAGDLQFDWVVAGDLYGSIIRFYRNNILQGGDYALPSYPSGLTLYGVSPIGTWSVRLFDGNNDELSRFNLTV